MVTKAKFLIKKMEILFVNLYYFNMIKKKLIIKKIKLFDNILLKANFKGAIIFRKKYFFQTIYIQYLNFDHQKNQLKYKILFFNFCTFYILIAEICE